jgi:hypothetical protein
VKIELTAESVVFSNGISNLSCTCFISGNMTIASPLGNKVSLISSHRYVTGIVQRDTIGFIRSSHSPLFPALEFNNHLQLHFPSFTSNPTPPDFPTSITGPPIPISALGSSKSGSWVSPGSSRVRGLLCPTFGLVKGVCWTDEGNRIISTH